MSDVKKVEVKKNSWIEKVLAKLNLSEESKASKMQKLMLRYYNEQKRIANSNIEKITRDHSFYLESAENKLEDLVEAENDAFVELDLDMIKTSDLRDNYVSVLDAQFKTAIKERKDKEEEIAKKTAEFEKSVKSYEDTLKLLEFIMSKLK